jgi:hypothetical protein
MSLLEKHIQISCRTTHIYLYIRGDWKVKGFIMSLLGMKVLENKVLKRIFRLKKDEGTMVYKQ